MLHVDSASGTRAYFAHDEYLQVAAGAGVVGVLLVSFAVGTVGSAVRRASALSSSAAGALVAFAVAAAFDFDWHLAALGLYGGWVAGLASPTSGEGSTDGGAVPVSGDHHR